MEDRATFLSYAKTILKSNVDGALAGAWHIIQMRWQLGCLVHCILGAATTLLHLVSYVSASGPGTIVSPRARALVDPIRLPIHVLENLKRSPADNTTFGAGLDLVELSIDRQCVPILIYPRWG